MREAARRSIGQYADELRQSSGRSQARPCGLAWKRAICFVAAPQRLVKVASSRAAHLARFQANAIPASYPDRLYVESSAMKTHRKAHIRFVDLPRDYQGLVRLLAPRPIHDRIDAAHVEEIVMAMAGFEEQMTADQQDYLELLTDLLYRYQQIHDPFPPRASAPLERLKYIMETSGTTAKDLERLLGCSQTMVSLILNGKRDLSKRNVVVLAQRFGVEPGYFL